jgi:hypothetical protein
MNCSVPDRALRIRLSGRFRVECPEGRDLTPRGAKNQALLALIATSPDLCRNRRWLEDKLWSDRGSDQSSAEVRRAFGPFGVALVADRQKVSLRQEQVVVDLSPAGAQEFLEGIDVRDVEFEAWLRSERHRRISLASCLKDLQRPTPDALLPQQPAIRRPPGQRQINVVLQKTRTTPDGLSLMEDLFIDCVALALRESLDITVYTRRLKPDLPGTILVTVQAFTGDGGDRFLRARASEVDKDRLLWSGNSAGQGAVRRPDDPEIVHFANQVVEVLGDVLTLQPQGRGVDPLVLQRLALRKLWTMNADRLVEAEALLALSDELAPRGLNAARNWWNALRPTPRPCAMKPKPIAAGPWNGTRTIRWSLPWSPTPGARWTRPRIMRPTLPDAVSGSIRTIRWHGTAFPTPAFIPAVWPKRTRLR